MRGRAFDRERERLALRLDEVIRGFLSDAGVPAVDDRLEPVLSKYAIGKHPETREMRFFIGNVACFTPSFANRLRRLVSEEFPRWAVVPQYDEREFTVSAEAVVFGSAVRGAVTESTPAFAEWLAETLAFDENWYGPLRRQLSWLRPRVPAALRRLPAERVVVVGAFDRAWGDEHRPVAWLLLRHADRDAEPSRAERLPQEYPVDAAGEAYPRFDKKFEIPTGAEPTAWLAACALDSPVEGTLSIPRAETGEIASVAVPTLIPDETLKGRR